MQTVCEIMQLPVMKEDMPEKYLRENNLLSNIQFIGRTQPMEIPKKMWPQIKDDLDDYTKMNFVSGYYTICVYQIKKQDFFSIPANTQYDKEISITRSSSTRTSSSETYRLESITEGNIAKGEASLRQSITAGYEINNLREYCQESSVNERSTRTYFQETADRDIAVYDINKIIYLIRKGNPDTIIGTDDYFLSEISVTYYRNQTQKEE